MLSRHCFLATLAAPLAAQPAERIIDIHQHTNYSGRTDEELIRHQRDMGMSKTVLLPAGSKYGLAAGASGNDTVVAIARVLPKEYVFFANELPDIPETRTVLEQYLDVGAIGAGEQKFPVEADSESIDLVASIAQEHNVPVLLHFEYKNYNPNFNRFYKVLDRREPSVSVRMGWHGPYLSVESWARTRRNDVRGSFNRRAISALLIPER